MVREVIDIQIDRTGTLSDAFIRDYADEANRIIDADLERQHAEDVARIELIADQYYYERGIEM